MNFKEVTELPGAAISEKQLQRMYTRYRWTANFCKNMDVLEVACGAGQGLGMISNVARSTSAGDISDEILEIAKLHYGSRIKFKTFDATSLPYENNSLDIVIIHEALYYVSEDWKFIFEVNRVLKKDGKLLITNSNKDLFDFHPSKFSTKYHGVCELASLLDKYGFTSNFWGMEIVKNKMSFSYLLRIIKYIAVKFNLIPSTMHGKLLLRRILFGPLLEMPAELVVDMIECANIERISSTENCRSHRILFCEAQKRGV